MDSTLAIFFNEDFGKTPIIIENGKQITIWYGPSNSSIFGELKIISDSSVAVGTDTVLVAGINALAKTNKKRLVGGLIVMGTGGFVTSVSLLGLKAVNEEVGDDLLLALAYIPVVIFFAGGTAIGAIITGVGGIVAITGGQNKVKVESFEIRQHYQMTN
ncbi:MAG: hypothetical protein R3279_04840 [Putridiphycobacter sp.]|nr:hypothetical protein [Putridiphycobacter sp.]